MLSTPPYKIYENIATTLYPFFLGDKRTKLALYVLTEGFDPKITFDKILTRSESSSEPYGNLKNNLLASKDFKEFFREFHPYDKSFGERAKLRILGGMLNYDTVISKTGDPRFTFQNLIDLFIKYYQNEFGTSPTSIDKETVKSSSQDADSFDAVDAYINVRFRVAWISSLSKNNIEGQKFLKKLYSDPKVISDDNSSLSGDKTYNIVEKTTDKQTGYYYSNKEDNLILDSSRRCEFYGIDPSQDNVGECLEILDTCVVNPWPYGTDDHLRVANKCMETLKKINPLSPDDKRLHGMNPEFVLGILNSLGFRTKDSSSGEKKIISYNTWNNQIKPKLFSSKLNVNSTAQKYIRNLIRYANTYYKQLFDRQDIPNVILPEKSSNYNPLRIRGYIPPNNFSDIRNVSDLYNGLRMRYMQGGNGIYDSEFVSEYMRRMSNGQAGLPYLKKLYNVLVNNLKNVGIDDQTKLKIEEQINSLSLDEKKIVEMLKFLEKLYHIRDTFPNFNIKEIRGLNIENLSVSLDDMIKKHREHVKNAKNMIYEIKHIDKNPTRSISAIFDLNTY